MEIPINYIDLLPSSSSSVTQNCLFPNPRLPSPYPHQTFASQTGLNRPVFLPLKPFIPDYKPNNHKSGKPWPKTPHSGRSEKTGPKQNTPILSSRLPFRAIFGSWVVRRSKKEISPSEDQKNGGEVIFCTSPLDPVTFR